MFSTENTALFLSMDGANPRLKVISPWHQYTAADPSATVQQFDVKDLTTDY